MCLCSPPLPSSPLLSSPHLSSAAKLLLRKLEPASTVLADAYMFGKGSMWEAGLNGYMTTEPVFGQAIAQFGSSQTHVETNTGQTLLCTFFLDFFQVLHTRARARTLIHTYTRTHNFVHDILSAPDISVCLLGGMLRGQEGEFRSCASPVR